jgi:endonuclease YncB( thermonuclease family)
MLPRREPCDGGHWHPGPLATKALIAFIAGRPVSCHQVDYDQKNNRPVAVCFAGKDDLQALMVSAGWAWAYSAFSDQYADAERRAAARGVGVHAHRCQPPWEWRTLHRASVSGPCGMVRLPNASAATQCRVNLGACRSIEGASTAGKS